MSTEKGLPERILGTKITPFRQYNAADIEMARVRVQALDTFISGRHTWLGKG